ncbi:hypothetical protein [Citrobacter freundii]
MFYLSDLLLDVIGFG